VPSPPESRTSTRARTQWPDDDGLTTMLRFEDPTALSLLFHLNSEPWLNDEAYAGASRQETLREAEPGRQVVQLPQPGESPLTTLLRKRRSARAFAARPLSLEVVSALAAAAQGVVEVVRVEGGGSLVRRAAPSAGGLYPLDVYLLARNVEGLPEGIYRYSPLTHSLDEIARGQVAEWLAAATYFSTFVEGANLILALVATFMRTQKKYGPRGYRYILLEAGHAVQNVCLRAVELDLATLSLGGFVDSELNEILRLRPTEQGAVYMVAVGAERSSEPPTE
jgi:SagB-type dehydrogenase family enzyme